MTLDKHMHFTLLVTYEGGGDSFNRSTMTTDTVGSWQDLDAALLNKNLLLKDYARYHDNWSPIYVDNEGKSFIFDLILDDGSTIPTHKFWAGHFERLISVEVIAEFKDDDNSSIAFNPASHYGSYSGYIASISN